ALRRVVERGGARPAGDESGHADARDRRLRPTCQHHLGIAERNQACGIADRVRTGRASGYNCVVGPLQAMGNRYIAGRQIDQSARNEEWRDTAWSSLLEHDCSLGNTREAPDPGPDHYPSLNLLLLGRRLPARIVQRLACRTHCKNDEIVDLALLLRLHPLVWAECPVTAITTWDLASNLGRQVG